MTVGWRVAALCAGIFLLPGLADARGPRRQVDFSESATDSSRAQARIENRRPSITRLKELIAKGPVGTQRAEMLLRLGELLYANGRDHRLIEEERFSGEYDRCFDDDGCDESALDADYDASTAVWRRAADLYEIIVHHHPRYARVDEAVFYLAATQSDLGDPQAAMDTRKRLVRIYPDSSFIADTYILLGEQYFDDNEAFKALRAYQRATGYPEHDKYGYALYMLAWCQYHVGELGPGIDTLKRVVSLARTTGDPLALEEDAVHDLVMFYTDHGDVDGALDFFVKIGRKDLIPPVMERAAVLLAEHGEYRDAIRWYRRLILEDPGSDRSVEHQHEIVRAYRRLDDHTRYVEEVERLLADYGPDAAWRSGQEQAVRDDADETVERALRDGAWGYHERSRKLARSGRDPKAFQGHARRLYASWLQAYPEDDHRYAVHHAYAELLYDLAIYAEAYDQFRWVLQIDPTGKYSEASARSAIFAAGELNDIERYAAAAEQYAIHYPGGEDTGNILYKTGHMLYEDGQYGRAADLFERVIRMDPGTKEAEFAAHLMMGVFEHEQRWEEVERRSRFYYEMEGLGSKKFKAETYEIYQNAKLKRIETTLADDRAAAAAALVAWVEEFPEAEKAAQALNNAAVYYDALGRFDEALEIRHVLVEDPRFGDATPVYFDHLAALGFAYEQIADFEASAHWYGRLVDEFAGDSNVREEVADALHLCAIFTDALGEWRSSVALYERFIEAYPEDDRVLDMRMTIGRIYEDQGKWLRAASTFEDVYISGQDLSSEYRFFAQIHHGRALEQLGRTSEAAVIYADTAAQYRDHLARGGSHGAHTEFAAESMFRLAKDQYDTYDAIALVGIEASMPQAEQDKLLNGLILEKMRGLTRLEQTYAEVVATGAGEWAIAAIVQMGLAHEEMSRALVESDRPTYLTDAQLVEYEAFLDQLVFTQREKSKRAYGLAVDKSTDLSLYNDNSHLALQRLDALDAEDAPIVHEVLIQDPYFSGSNRAFSYEQSL